MIKAAKIKWVVAVAILLAAGLVVAWYGVRDSLFLASIAPPATFQPAPSPAPDYSTAEAWVSRPDPTPPGAWESPWGVDVFFVLPTTAYKADGHWNAGVETSAKRERRVAEVFAAYGKNLDGAGPVYAPKYRQAVLSSILGYSQMGAQALDLAYQDVMAAFDQYLANHNNRRAIMLVGVEQGGLHVARLLREKFQDPSLLELLAAVYLIDTPITEDSLPIPLCRTASETGCVVAWQLSRSRQASRSKSRAKLPTVSAAGIVTPLGESPIACVNPLNWTTGSGLAPASDHLGGATSFDKDGEPAGLLEKRVSTQCVDGLLNVSPDAASLRKDGFWGWGAKFVTPGGNLFYANIAANAVSRSRTFSAWLDDHGRKPAPPLPPILQLDEAPIHREGDQRRPL